MNSTPRTAVVSGAARGIGLACATALAERGHRVVLVDRDEPALAEAVAGLPADRVMAVQADLGNRQAPALVQAAVQRQGFGPVSILVNNAGIAPKHQGRSHTILEIDLDEWDRVIELNLSAAMLMSRQFLPGMVAQRWGRIVNMSSLAGRGKSVISGPAYMASKAGLLGLTRHIAAQFAKDGITANAVAPGRVSTALGAQLDPQIAAQAIAQIPVGREGTTQDVAAAVCFLASEEAAYCNGSVIDVNGGIIMQ